MRQYAGSNRTAPSSQQELFIKNKIYQKEQVLKYNPRDDGKVKQVIFFLVEVS